MNNKNSRTNPLPGFRKKSGPPNNPSISDSTNRGNIKSNIRILSDAEVENKKARLKLISKTEKYVPGVDGPKFIGGAVPFGRGRLDSLRTAWDLGSKMYKKFKK